jgi:hypothetical protein
VTRPHSTPSPKPAKPYPAFPLTPHPPDAGARRSAVRFHYFGSIDDPQVALDRYLAEKDALHAGRRPRPDPDALTVEAVVLAFLNHKAGPARCPRAVAPHDARLQRSRETAWHRVRPQATGYGPRHGRLCRIAKQDGQALGTAPAGQDDSIREIGVQTRLRLRTDASADAVWARVQAAHEASPAQAPRGRRHADVRAVRDSRHETGR